MNALLRMACMLLMAAACIRTQQTAAVRTPLTKSRHSCQDGNGSKQSKLAESHFDGVPF